MLTVKFDNKNKRVWLGPHLTSITWESPSKKRLKLENDVAIEYGIRSKLVDDIVDKMGRTFSFLEKQALLTKVVKEVKIEWVD